ncbi:MAG TPA: alcohol dehydrogenase catalytic domain-containing protein [Sporichthyaceae bacterium]|nr:alcohol dehydrogenase catalytic domain-containing protein [Sporichthyaceae bacterium]
MQAVVLKKAYEIAVEEVPKPSELGSGEVLLKVEQTAICGTDLGPYSGKLELEDDVRIGHEFLGTITDVGPGVNLFDAGDRVVVSCVVNCGHCYLCRKNQPGKCMGVMIFGLGLTFGNLDGGQAEYVIVPNADLCCRKLPEGGAGTDEDYLFVGDIMATGYESVRAAFEPGDTVAVVGAGPVGLCAAMSAVALGARQVVVIDRVAERLKEAESYGAITVNPDETDPVDAVLDLTDWRGADVVVDAAGHSSALNLAFRLPRAGGSLSVPAVYVDETLDLPWGEIWLKGIRLVASGAMNIPRYMDETLALIAAGKLNPARMISHRMPMSQAAEAYRLFYERQATKIILDPTR